MSTINGLKPNMSVSWWPFLGSLCITLIGFILIIVVIILIKKHSNNSDHTKSMKQSITNRSKAVIKKDFLSQLKILKVFINKNPQKYQYIFFKLSEILRGFIEEYYHIQTLSKNKTELISADILVLDTILKYSYEIQFALRNASEGVISESVNLVNTYISNAT